MRLILPVLCLAQLIPFLAVPPNGFGQTNPAPQQPCLGGDYDAPIRIEVFSDFMCSSCRAFYLQTIQSVLKEYCSVNKVCVVYHEFPLRSNRYSRQAARYSKAAQTLGRKQWIAVMHALYQEQESWFENGAVDDVVLKALPADDYSRLKKVLLNPSIETAIDSEIALGEKKEVTATPTFFLYAIGREQKVVGSLPYPILKNFFDSIVK